MSALAMTMPLEEVVPVYEEAELPRQTKVLLDSHANEMKVAMECYPHARVSRAVPLSVRFGKRFMEKQDAPTVIGSCKF